MFSETPADQVFYSGAQDKFCMEKGSRMFREAVADQVFQDLNDFRNLFARENLVDIRFILVFSS